MSRTNFVLAAILSGGSACLAGVNVSAVSVKRATVFEGDTGTADALLTIELDAPAPTIMTVQAQTEPGTATSSDFHPVSTVLTFAAGESEKTFAVPIIGDTVPESTESFRVTLSDPTGGLVIADGSATVTIHDNDGSAFGSVVINEVCAAPGNHAIRFEDDGTPRLGMGVPWTDPSFDDNGWLQGALPAGHGLGGLSTDLGSVMTGVTPSLYLRREFNATAVQAATSVHLILSVDFNDGFIAYLNGVEVARANMGPPQHFVYARQPAYNTRPSSSPVPFDLGPASSLLVPGRNVLAIQAHNAVVNPADSNFNLSPTFRVNAGLQLANPVFNFVSFGPGGGSWKYLVGLAEPSGGLVDPVLLAGGFAVPAGAAKDFVDLADFSDWIELRNQSASPIDLGDWMLSDNLANPDKWRFPPGTTLPAAGYLLVLCDDREEANGFSQPQRSTLIAGGATWKFYDQDAAPPSTWNSRTFADSSWSSGPAPLGYSPNNEDGAATVIAGGQNTHLTNYFRFTFAHPGPASIIGDLTIRYQRDDGLLVWLNGSELARDNMPAGIPTHTTPAAGNASGEGNWYTQVVPASSLVAGDNVLAVEVHQVSLGSSDVRFDLELTAWEQSPGAPAAMLHASFALGAGGEPLTLHTGEGSLVDALADWPDQDSFRSWGRSGTNPTLLGYQDATPGGANAATAFPARTARPRFLSGDGVTPLPSGFYNTNQTLILSCPTPGATIRYTTDGSEPLETGNGLTYSGPLSLVRPDAKTAVIIRARAFAPGLLPSRDLASTYLINQSPPLRTLPVISLVADPGRSLFLPQGIMAVNGGSFDGEGKWQPGDFNSYHVPQHRGSTTERETSVELIYPDGSPGFRDKVAVRIAGSGYTRPRYKFQRTNESPWALFTPPEKGSMNLIWRDEIGAGELDYELFPGWPTTTFTQIRLRAGNNDNINPFICDEYVRRLFGEMGQDSLRGMFAMLYVNGSFKGIYNPAERLRNDTFQNHFRSSNDWDVKYVNDYQAGDSTEHTRFRSIYDKDMSVPANFAAMQQAADLVNFADYYLLNIYANMWDWATWGGGANNYVLYRERIPNGVWRFTVWDAEGGFRNQSYFNAPSFDLIAENLTGNDDTNELATIWKRLVGVPPFTGSTKGNPEFRLLVADRIQRHFFNGGVLDDRNPANRVHALKEELKSMVQTGIESMNSPWNEQWFTQWVASGSGRRAHLFGPTDTQFPDAGVWPTTTPPLFSQHGGDFNPGNLLTISGVPGGGMAWFTTDGSDPRLAGGSLSPSALAYAGGITVDRNLTVNARVRSATGEWSALTSARFSVPLARPAADTLVISEIMYHPPAPSPAEAAAGYTDADDFEFLRFSNVGPAILDLEDLRLTDGVLFDFSTADVASLNPGGSVLLVANRDAFSLRYGNAIDSSIAGQYLGSLRNSGESIQLELVGPAATVLHNVPYGDRAPWPESADGYGPSLLLDSPAGAPDHSLPSSWTSSAHPGGHPGGFPRPMTYEEWKQLTFPADQAANPSISGPFVDADSDLLLNFIEYALGGVPRLNDAGRLQPRAASVDLAAQSYLTIEYHTIPTALDASLSLELSTDLQNWMPATTTGLAAPTATTDGRLHFLVRLNDPIPSSPSRAFVHLRADN